MPKLTGGLVVSITPGSPADQAGLRIGDRLTAINGQPLHDIIDYRYYGADETLELAVSRGEVELRLTVLRDYGEDLGITFSEMLFDGMRMCRNKCPFCFVDQMPKGLRPSLYLHDDDYRYSFLLGNYVTLTNLSADDWQRIGEQGLSPLYVSIHAADTAVRRQVLGNPRAPDVMAQLRRLGELGIVVHGQVVIWPGVNDDAVLRDTIHRVAGLWPIVQSLALVPVGVTTFKCQDVRGITPDEARTILDIADYERDRINAISGCTWLFPTDELYLLAGRPVPKARFYDDDAQWQNGVGMVRDLLDDWSRTRRRLSQVTAVQKHITLVCGELIAPTLTKLAGELATRLCMNAEVVPVINRLFGNSVTVSGLLSGADVCAALNGKNLGDCVFLPDVMFNRDTMTTLDDMSIQDLSASLHVPIHLVSAMSEVVAVLAHS